MAFHEVDLHDLNLHEVDLEVASRIDLDDALHELMRDDELPPLPPLGPDDVSTAADDVDADPFRFLCEQQTERKEFQPRLQPGATTAQSAQVERLVSHVTKIKVGSTYVDVVDLARSLGVPAFFLVNGNFATSCDVQDFQCQCGRCEMCFGKNLLLLRKHMGLPS